MAKGVKSLSATCQPMHTQVHIPVQSQLKDYVVAMWEVKGDNNSREIILPQGVVEIIFSFADEITGILPHKKTVEKVSHCFIQGVHTHIVHSAYAGAHHLFGIQLQPHRVYDLLGVIPSELHNTTVDLSLIDPLFSRLWHQLREAKTYKERVAVTERELPFINTDFNRRSAQISTLFQQNGVSFQSVDELARLVYYSTRQLNRIVHQLFGFSAEELTTYKKFIESVKLIHSNNASLTSIGYDAGFYDQAHFSRVFKSYTGFTPNEYRKQKSDLPFHLYPAA